MTQATLNKGIAKWANKLYKKTPAQLTNDEYDVVLDHVGDTARH